MTAAICHENLSNNCIVFTGNNFVGDYYWKLTDDGIASGYPRTIHSSWTGLPGNIDAAFTYKNGKTYFFKVNDCVCLILKNYSQIFIIIVYQ